MATHAPAHAPALRYLHTRTAGVPDPLATAVRLARSGLADRCAVYEQDGRWWFAGGALGEVTVHQDTVTTQWNGERRVTPRTCGHAAQDLGAALAGAPVADWRGYGWVAFESAAAAVGRAAADPRQPLAHAFVPAVEVEIGTGGLDVRCAAPDLLQRVLTAVHTPEAVPDLPARPLDVEAEGPAAYEEAVADAVARINRGDLEKVILSRRVEVPFALDFPGTYAAGRRANTPARSFLLDLPGLRAVGFSPETVAEVGADGWVTSQPLAGTRARHADDPVLDARTAAELRTDVKEIYEHAVSVQLADTEMRALCAPGSVAVEEFMAVKERGSVRHLGSRVRGRLRADRTRWDALAALFPAVTASGIPKPPAYDVIADHEPPRGLYSGAVLRATADGDLDAALALRTVYTHQGRTWVRAGAGIVGVSRPAREYRETCEKLASVAPYLVPARP
ncbi:putative anthranilate synthase component I [Actinacidiphila reveromycinica]|uniref:Putative anthranilate synthase component I n=1 Tax=Actinacidiphila reveromycinica TaxID=659352 RepID=A0A7U3V133_9ACTN|nr:salicylate synthase [Streptomyces sp. SN-593]BBB02302.1 putative anthranilate synthase component I [Streptomyces sp. SN-593]